MRAHRAQLPNELRQRPRWVTHSLAKVPLTPKGRPASATNPATWSSFEAVREMPRKGFVLNGDGIVCLDLDHCLDGDRVAPWAQEILSRLPRTYVEVSPSGDGLHVWGRGPVASGRRIRDGRCIEVYGAGRYITVTGRRFGDCSSVLSDLSGVLATLLT